MTDCEKRAKELSLNFLEAEKQYRLGFVEAEHRICYSKDICRCRLSRAHNRKKTRRRKDCCRKNKIRISRS